MTKLPNVLSCSRIVLSVALLFVAGHPVGFMALYCLCGLTDIADGSLARAYRVKSRLGSRLDSIGDIVFFGVWIYLFAHYINGEHFMPIIACMVGVAVIRMANLVITKIKFTQWSMMHTIGNKAAGLALFLALPLFILTDNAPFWSIALLGILSGASALEETVILLKYTDYDADRRSVIAK